MNELPWSMKAPPLPKLLRVAILAAIAAVLIPAVAGQLREDERRERLKSTECAQFEGAAYHDICMETHEPD